MSMCAISQQLGECPLGMSAYISDEDTAPKVTLHLSVLSLNDDTCLHLTA